MQYEYSETSHTSDTETTGSLKQDTINAGAVYEGKTRITTIGMLACSLYLLMQLTSIVGPWLMAGAGYESDSNDADTEETGTETESTRGFVLQDDDGGDKFVVKVR